jgi:hypothetical protein
MIHRWYGSPSPAILVSSRVVDREAAVVDTEPDGAPRAA